MSNREEEEKCAAANTAKVITDPNASLDNRIASITQQKRDDGQNSPNTFHLIPFKMLGPFDDAHDLFLFLFIELVIFAECR